MGGDGSSRPKRPQPAPVRIIPVENQNRVMVDAVRRATVLPQDPEVGFADKVVDARALTVRARDVRPEDFLVMKNPDGAEVFARIDRTRQVGDELTVELTVDNFGVFEKRTQVFPLNFPIELNVLRPRAAFATSAQQDRIKSLLAKKVDNSVVDPEKLDELDVNEAREAITALLALPNKSFDTVQNQALNEVFEQLGAPASIRQKVIDSLADYGINSPETVPTPITLTAANNLIADGYFDRLSALKKADLRPGDIVTTRFGTNLNLPQTLFQVVAVHDGAVFGISLNRADVRGSVPEVEILSVEGRPMDRDSDIGVLDVYRPRRDMEDWFGLDQRGGAFEFNVDSIDDEGIRSFISKADEFGAALASGWTEVSRVDTPGAMGRGPAFVELNDTSFDLTGIPNVDPSQIFIKYSISQGARDGEVLSAAIANAIGIEGLIAQKIDSDNIVAMGKVDGKMTIDRWDSPALSYDLSNLRDEQLVEAIERVKSNQVALIGLLDILTSNGDRHEKNWMVTNDDIAVPIDNGFAFNQDGSIYAVIRAGGPAAGVFPELGWGANISSEFRVFSKAELLGYRMRLEALRELFDSMGRSDWYIQMMDRMAQLIGRTD